MVGEVSKAFPNAKNVRFKDNSVYFTMPNGVEMQVEFISQITDSGMDERAERKSHGVSSKGDIVIGGLHRKLGKGVYDTAKMENRIASKFLFILVMLITEYC